MEYSPEQFLPETDQKQKFTPEQEVTLLAEWAGHLDGTQEQPGNTGRVHEKNGVAVTVQYDPVYYHDRDYKVTTPEGEVLIGPDTLVVKTDGGEIAQGQDRVEVLGKVATNLRNLVEGDDLPLAA
jgi:hypothetical protein